MLPLQTPPAHIRLAGVHERYAEARDAAKENKHSILGILLRHPGERQTVEAFLRTDEGVSLRSYFNIWLPETSDLPSELKAAKAPEPAGSEWMLLDDKGKRQAETPISATADLARVLSDLDRSVSEGGGHRPGLDELRHSHPSLPDPDRFLAFGDARSKDLGAGAKEPFRSWLMQLLKAAPDSAIGHWAAFRLMESGAVLQPGEINPAQIVLQDCQNALSNRLGVNEAPDTPYLFEWEALGRLQDFDSRAPYLATFRTQMGQAPRAFSSKLYAFIARHLAREDRPWILGCWKAASSTDAPKGEAPESNPVYWVATDWLISCGRPEDWQVFLDHSPSPDWRRPLDALMGKVRKVPAFWSRTLDPDDPGPPDVLHPATFWEAPEASAKALGVDLEAFQTEGVRLPSILSQPFFDPAYPSKAAVGFRLYRGQIQIRCLVDAEGRVSAIHPLPAFGLHLFAPDLLRYMSRVTFTPASVGGKPVACPFSYHWTFLVNP